MNPESHGHPTGYGSSHKKIKKLPHTNYTNLMEIRKMIK